MRCGTVGVIPYVAVSQNLRYLFGVGKATLVFLKGLLGVHRGTGVLTHNHVFSLLFKSINKKL